MGYDTAERSTRSLSELYRQAYNEQRAVVTRNRRVRPSRLFRIIQLDSQHLSSQLQQLVRELGIRSDAAHAFSRCDRCNVEVEPIEASQVKDRVPPYVWRTQQRFRRCPSCQRIYWAATHYERISKTLEHVAR